MANSAAGLQSDIDVNSSPTVPSSSGMKIHTWTWAWFIIAMLVIVGFHIRVFGKAVPPTAHFP